MAMQQIRFVYGSTSGVVTWNGAEASAPILLDGTETGFQTADARHRSVEAAVRLVLEKEFGALDVRDVDYIAG